MFKYSQFVAIALCAAACSQPAVQSTPAPSQPSLPPTPAPRTMPVPGTTATATLRDLAGALSGNVNFTDTRTGVLITGTITGMGLGWHGVHIHGVGKCEPPFTTAGGHLNLENKHHGFLSADGPHTGDLPNVDTPPSGPIHFEFLMPDVSLKGHRALLDTDGASIIVHSGRDDYATDPAGNSGARMACGVITAR
jgi:superoxide dismutase, Cu-Zn family